MTETDGSTAAPPATLRHLDGNALAGWLSELFAVDMTMADASCAACGQAWVLAELRVYAGPHAPGLVARCPGCEAVVLRFVRGLAVAWLDLRGAALLRIPLPQEPPPPAMRATSPSQVSSRWPIQRNGCQPFVGEWDHEREP